MNGILRYFNSIYEGFSHWDKLSRIGRERKRGDQRRVNKTKRRGKRSILLNLKFEFEHVSPPPASLSILKFFLRGSGKINAAVIHGWSWGRDRFMLWKLGYDYHPILGSEGSGNVHRCFIRRKLEVIFNFIGHNVPTQTWLDRRGIATGVI